MNTKKFTIKDITKENSKAYGTLVELKGTTPAYKGEDFSFTKHLATTHFSEKVSFSMVESYPNNRLTGTLEYHNNTPEALVPVGEDVIITLALGENTPDPTTINAFRLKMGQAFIIDPKVWHYAPLTETKTTHIFVIFNESTPEKDVVQVDVEKELGFKIEI